MYMGYFTFPKANGTAFFLDGSVDMIFINTGDGWREYLDYRSRPHMMVTVSTNWTNRLGMYRITDKWLKLRGMSRCVTLEVK